MSGSGFETWVGIRFRDWVWIEVGFRDRGRVSRRRSGLDLGTWVEVGFQDEVGVGVGIRFRDMVEIEFGGRVGIVFQDRGRGLVLEQG